MNIFISIYAVFVGILYLLVFTLSELKILQLEEYNIIKLFKYNIKNRKVKLLIDLITLTTCFICLTVKNDTLNSILVLCCLTIQFLYVLCFKINNDNIYPKFTKRILRIIITIIVMIICIYILSINLDILQYICEYVTITLEILTISAIILNLIFELILSNFFIKSACKKLQKQKMIKIAITGSYAKTSVKNFLTTILQEKYSVISSPKSYNTVNGFSLTVNKNNLSNYDVFIMEIGARKKGEIRRLCKYFKPQYGILTSIEKQHIESFRNIENIIIAKKELQDNLSEDSFMVFNCNNENVEKLYLTHSKYKCSVGITNDLLYGVSGVINKIDLDGCDFDIYYKGDFFCKASCSLIGEHNVINILLAVAMAIKLGLSASQISSGVMKLKPVESRMQPIEISGNNVVINNGYNSNPSSARASLELIKLYDKIKAVIACGFVEMGKEQFNLNYELGKSISCVADKCYIVNKVNREAIYRGLKDGGFEGEVIFVDKFKDINFNNFKDSVILIENDLPDNYV